MRDHDFHLGSWQFRFRINGRKTGLSIWKHLGNHHFWQPVNINYPHVSCGRPFGLPDCHQGRKRVK
jgi:hypothetical protein